MQKIYHENVSLRSFFITENDFSRDSFHLPKLVKTHSLKIKNTKLEDDNCLQPFYSALVFGYV
jgi:hypothetical protein